MALQIVWTENGLADYKQVVDYLLQEWPIKVASEFVRNVESRIETLSVFPEIGIASLKEPGVRSIILTKHNKLYYKVADNKLEILNIFDTRQNPTKNKYD
jgi:plasmid stabilization system protein ParE